MNQKFNNFSYKQIDSYSMLIISKYFESQQDYINVICVCKKFKETTEKLRFNPIPITSLKLFPKIQTQYLYSDKDTKIKGIGNYEIWYEVDYDQYLKYKDNIKCHYTIYSEENKEKYGNQIPDCITLLGDKCFFQCPTLESITIPTKITSLGRHCFCYCYDLKSVDIPFAITSMGIWCFYFCTSLTSIHLPSSLKSLRRRSFSNCLSLKSIYLPSAITSIGSHCFFDCASLTSLSIPIKIKKVKLNCFNGCTSLKELSVPLNENKKYPFKVSYDDYLILKQHGIDCEKVIYSGNLYGIKLKDIPKDIPIILNNSIESKLKTIPSNIISLKGNYLSLEIRTIKIHTAITYLCDECFKDYFELRSITIPTTVKYIGKHLIDNCISLTQFNYEGNWNNIVVSYDDHLRYKSKKLVFNNIEFTNDDKKKYENVIPLIVHSLHQSYFDRLSEMIHIPTHITSLDNHMFGSLRYNLNQNPSNLKSITILTSIRIIPKYCFLDCKLLSTIELPSTLISIKKKAFSKCTSLKFINIPLSVTSIEDYAFKNCSSLSKVTLSFQLKETYNTWFVGCRKLRIIYTNPKK